MAAGFNHFPEITVQMHKQLVKAVKTTVNEIQSTARVYAAKATGFMANSVYTVTQDKSTYGTGHVDMTPYEAMHRELLPEVDAPTDDLTGKAAVGATYGADVNYGTVHMAGRPFWEPAIDAGKVTLDYELSKIDANVQGSIR